MTEGRRRLRTTIFCLPRSRSLRKPGQPRTIAAQPGWRHRAVNFRHRFSLAFVAHVESNLDVLNAMTALQNHRRRHDRDESIIQPRAGLEVPAYSYRGRGAPPRATVLFTGLSGWSFSSSWVKMGNTRASRRVRRVLAADTRAFRCETDPFRPVYVHGGSPGLDSKCGITFLAAAMAR